MDNDTERKNQLDENRKLALQAKGLFIEVSIANPASAIGQAARIAQKCKTLNLSPTSLMDNLLSSDDLMSELRTIGNNYHIKKGAARTKPLREDELERVIKADFEMADDLVSLTNEQLSEIYAASDGKPTSEEQEEELLQKAKEWLKPHGVDFIPYTSVDLTDETFR